MRRKVRKMEEAKKLKWGCLELCDLKLLALKVKTLKSRERGKAGGHQPHHCPLQCHTLSFLSSGSNEPQPFVSLTIKKLTVFAVRYELMVHHFYCS